MGILKLGKAVHLKVTRVKSSAASAGTHVGVAASQKGSPPSCVVGQQCHVIRVTRVGLLHPSRGISRTRVERVDSASL